VNFHLKKSWIYKLLLLPTFTSIVFALTIHQTQAQEVEASQGKALESAVYYDKNTNLEWVAGPDKDTNWYEAKSWVKDLTVTGGGWRLPTVEELKTLYKKGTGERNMTPLLKTTGWWVWSGETRGSSSAWNFNYYYGYEIWDVREYSSGFRGFAVRSRK
jgi:hypothetical protein